MDAVLTTPKRIKTLERLEKLIRGEHAFSYFLIISSDFNYYALNSFDFRKLNNGITIKLGSVTAPFGSSFNLNKLVNLT